MRFVPNSVLPISPVIAMVVILASMDGRSEEALAIGVVVCSHDDRVLCPEGIRGGAGKGQVLRLSRSSWLCGLSHHDAHPSHLNPPRSSRVNYNARKYGRPVSGDPVYSLVHSCSIAAEDAMSFKRSSFDPFRTTLSPTARICSTLTNTRVFLRRCLS